MGKSKGNKSAGKQSKNNPDLKVKRKENKIHESAFCENVRNMVIVKNIMIMLRKWARRVLDME